MPSSESVSECREALEAHVAKVKLSPEIEAVVQRAAHNVAPLLMPETTPEDDARLLQRTETLIRAAVTESLALAGRDTERLDWLEAHAKTFAEIWLGRYRFAAPNQNKRWMAKIEYWEHYDDTIRGSIDGLRSAAIILRHAGGKAGS